MSNTWKDCWCVSDDGLKLYAREYAAADQDASTVLCIPGLTRSSADFHELCVHLSTRFRVLAVDLRGRGRSDYDPNPRNYTPIVYINDVLGMIEQLELENIVLVGTSLGALVSMLMAVQKQSLFAGIVLNDFAPQLEAEGLQRIKSYVGKLPPVHTWQEAAAQAKLINGRECPGLSSEEWLSFARNLYRENEQGCPVFDYDPAISQPLDGGEGNTEFYDVWPVFDSLPDIPLLLLRGEISDLVSRETVMEMKRRKPTLQTIEVSGRGHAPLLNEPQSLAAIELFMAQFEIERSDVSG